MSSYVGYALMAVGCSIAIAGCDDLNEEFDSDTVENMAGPDVDAEQALIAGQGRQQPDEGAELPLAAPSGDGEPPVDDDRHDSGFDFEEPPPLTEVSWTSEAFAARSLDSLEYVVVNHTAKPKHFNVVLTWDSGTTRGHVLELESFTVAPQASETRTLSRADVPQQTASGIYPGLIQLSLQSPGDDGHVLPSFFVMPRDTSHFNAAESWSYELMNRRELLRATEAEHGRGTARVVQWSPGATATQDVDGGVQ